MRLLALLIATASAFAQGQWERRAPYPVVATEVSAAALNGKIHALCGLLPSGGNTATLYIYDPYLDEWSAGPPAPIAGGGDHCNVAAVNGKLYVLGAIRVGTSFVDGNTYEYDPGQQRWSIAGRMNEARGASGVAAIAGRIYVAGGLADGRSVNTLEVFDPETRQWTRLRGMPTARDHLTAQAINGKLYAIAGRVGSANLTANEEYDPARDEWLTRAPIPTARGGLGSGALRNRIQVFGGEGPSGRPEQTFEQNEEYDPVSNTWGTLALMQTPRHGLYGATLDGRIFTPGGGPRIGATFSNAHDAFYLPLPDPPAVASLSNAASMRSELAPGALVTLKGLHLSQGEQESRRFPTPTQMNLTTVRVNNAAVPVTYVSPTQINFQLPYTFVPGPVNVTVTHVTSTSVVFSGPDAMSVGPGLFALSGNGEGQGAIRIANTGLIARAANDGISRPARRGEFLEIYATGLGRLDFPPRFGELAGSNPPSQTLETPEVMIGGAPAEVNFSGLTTWALGVYQINARIAMNALTGNAVPVVVRIGGRTSNTVTVAIAD
ncbi:MAG: hypothetical protein HY235_28120 [Acidobacteria bacterium]|nr:hypothetical protein [Acidobacteriota bacterium]